MLHVCDLFEDVLSVAAWRGGPADRLEDLDRLLACDFAIVSPGNLGDFTGLFDDGLKALGKSRRTVVSVSNFLLLPHILDGSHLVALAPRRLAAVFARAADLVWREPPILMEPFPVSMLWHQKHHRDASSAWLRGLFLDAAREVARQDAPFA
jgi:DNA-binding transcriptional LysR family regulator